jgi:hypothetical protein
VGIVYYLSFPFLSIFTLSLCFLGAVNKQLNDKERVAAAFENPNLVDLVEKCLVSTEQ